MIEQAAEIGGQLLKIHCPIGNYPGVDTANGRELRDKIAAQINKLGKVTIWRETVERIDTDTKKVILANGDAVSGRYLIIATGVRRRLLGVPGEIEFGGRGVIESGVREASSTAGTVVAVIGGGDAALENAVILSKHARLVYLIHRRSQFVARKKFVDSARATSNIRMFMSHHVKAIVGNSRLEGIEIENLDTREQSALPLDFALIRIGVEPNSDKIRNSVEVDPHGYIIVDSKGETSVHGIYAIGDVANPIAPTIVGAVGDGATAAKAIAAEHFAVLG